MSSVSQQRKENVIIGNAILTAGDKSKDSGVRGHSVTAVIQAKTLEHSSLLPSSSLYTTHPINKQIQSALPSGCPRNPIPYLLHNDHPHPVVSQLLPSFLSFPPSTLLHLHIAAYTVL